MVQYHLAFTERLNRTLKVNFYKNHVAKVVFGDGELVIEFADQQPRYHIPLDTIIELHIYKGED